jgi:membrane protease YdiL (CAAX protease family)
VFAAHLILIPALLSGFAPRPGVVIEDKERITLARASVAFGPVAEVTSTARVLAVAGATRESARITATSLRDAVLHVQDPVLVNGTTVSPGARRLVPGDLLAIGDLRVRYELPSLVLVFLFFALQQLLTAALVILVVRRRGGTLGDLGLTLAGAPAEVARGITGYLAIVPIYAVLGLAWGAVLSKLRVPVKSHPLLEWIQQDPSWSSIAGLILLAVIVGPIAEEIFFRGFFLRALRHALPSRVAAVLVASFVFAAFHPGLVSLVPIMLVGALFGTLFNTSPRGSIVGSIVAHVSFNGVNAALELSILRASG